MLNSENLDVNSIVNLTPEARALLTRQTNGCKSRAWPQKSN
jgi:hypothetical protein